MARDVKRTADGVTVIIVAEGWNRDAARIQKEIVSVEDVVTNVVIRRTVKLLCARLGNSQEYRTTCSAVLRAVVARQNLEFRQGVRGRSRHRGSLVTHIGVLTAIKLVAGHALVEAIDVVSLLIVEALA